MPSKLDLATRTPAQLLAIAWLGGRRGAAAQRELGKRMDASFGRGWDDGLAGRPSSPPDQSDPTLYQYLEGYRTGSGRR